MTEVTDFGRFSAHWTEDDPVLYFRSEDGLDWYDMLHAVARLTPDGKFQSSVYGVWAMVDDTGIVCGAEIDPTKLAPHFHRVLGVDADPGEVRARMVWNGEEFIDGDR